MRTSQDKMLDFLGQEGVRFTVPHYQRPYAWTETQCEELMWDILRAGRAGTSHFMSMVLFLESPAGAEGGVRELDVIDGQQRIASATLLLAALETALRTSGKEVGGLDADAVRRRFLLADDGACKVRLQGLDQRTLDALVLGAESPERPSARIVDNHRYFASRLAEEGFDFDLFWRGLNRLFLIDVELDDGDKAQHIFEGVNTKGMPLATADLVRNYLLVGETREEQERLYREYWNPIELMFGNDPGCLKLNAGIRMWLSIRFRRIRIRDKSQTYNVFKAYMTEEYEGTTEELLEELRGFCLMWSENYKFNEVKEFRSMDWVKGKTKTLLPGWGHLSGF